MAVTKTKQFYVGDTSNQDKLRGLGISNIGDAGYDATDRSRLYMHYDSKAGQINLNPLTDVYGRANLMGGNYTFDPKGDYLNQGPFGPTDTNPIHPGSELTNPNTFGVMGTGGARYGPDNLQIGFPRVSSDSSNSTNGPSCPTGFYYYNGTCVPGAMMDPSNPNNVLGFNTGSGSFQNAKGVILRVITPVSTQKGALFQIVTNIQNVGHQPGKFYTKVSIPQLGLTEVESNSAFLQGGQQGVLYATLQMPATVPANASLLTVQSDLYQSNIGNPTATPAHDDTNTAQMPAPGTQYGMKPPTPPIPQFPVGGNTGSFGYPYNAPPNNPMPLPPPPPPYRGFSARRSYQGYYDQLSPYGAQTPPEYPIYPSSPASDPYNYYQPPMGYQQGPPPPYQPRFLGPPMQAPPYPYPDSDFEFQTTEDDNEDEDQNMGGGGGLINVNIPSSLFKDVNIQELIDKYGDKFNPFTNGAAASNNMPAIGNNNVTSQNTDDASGGDDNNTSDFNDAQHAPANIPGMPAGAVTGASIQKSAHRIQHDVDKQLRAAGIHTNHHKHKGKRHVPGQQHHHHSNSNLAYITPEPNFPGMFRAGNTVSIKISGFRPFEPVMVQLYSLVTLMGIRRFSQLIGRLGTRANGHGKVEMTLSIPLTLIGRMGAIVAMGSISRKRKIELLQVVG